MDREAVITHLQIIHTWAEFARERDLQFFTAKHLEDIAQWADDALNLLKEQEAKQAIKQTYHVMMNRDYENPVEVTRYDWLCPTCKSLLCRDIDVIDDNYHFCKACGQAVKFE